MINALIKSLNRAAPGICPDVGSWTTANGLGKPTVIREAEAIERPLPRILGSTSLDDFAQRQTDSSNRFFTVTIPRARICGSHGLVQLPDGPFAWDYLTHDETRITSSPFYAQRYKFGVRRRRMAGTYFSLTGLWCTTHYHWLHDSLQRLWAHEEWLPHGTSCIIPEELDPKYLPLLQTLGISNHQLVRQPHNEIWDVDRLVFASPPSITGRTAPKPAKWLQAKLAEFAAPVATSTRRARLYVTRAGATSRRVVNEPELHQILADRGFSIVCCEHASMEETARLFQSAEVVVGAHGAGLVNSLFCEPNTKILELFPGEVAGRICYWTLASGIGHQYLGLLAERVSQATDDMTISPRRLAAALDQLDVS